MAVVLVLVGSELRRSWRRLLGIALVVVVGGGSVMLALAGARRADTAFERFRTSVDDGHVFVGIDEAPGRVGELDALPTVEAVAPFGYVAIGPVDAPVEAGIEGGGFASLDGRWLYDVQRPRVLGGQMPDADAGTQMVVNEVFAEMFGATAGDVVPMEAATSDAFAGVGDPAAVVAVDVQVAAVVRTVLDIGVNVGGPTVYFPPGFLRAHPDIGYAQGFAMVRLTDGDASFAEFERAASAAFAHEPSFTARLASAESRTIERALGVQVTALIVVAAAIATAGAALLLQAITRWVRRTSESNHPLRSIGVNRGQRIAVLAVPPLVAVSFSLAMAVGASVALSWLMPRGLARVAEPDPGLYADGALLAAVGLVVLLLATAFLLSTATLATRVASQSLRKRAGRGERAVLWLQEAGASLPIVTGVRLALPSRTADRRFGSLASFAGLVIGLAALIAATAFGARLTEVAVDSGAWGTPFDLYAGIDGPGAASTMGGSEAAAIPGIANVTTAHYAEVVDLGETDAPGYGVHADEGQLSITAVEGRPPAANTEVLLGVGTAEALHVGVGDTVRFPADASGSVALTVVGLG
ncbi:MAG: ABC transporter permease, partial [Acidimicrobiales bacterium]